MPYGYSTVSAPAIPVDVTPSAGLTDSDLEVGLRVGKVAINSNPADHATVEILDHTFEFVASNDSPSEGNIAVQRGTYQDGAASTGRITLTSTPTYSTGTLSLGNKTYTFAYENPFDGTFWIPWSNFISESDGITAIQSAINAHDGSAFAASRRIDVQDANQYGGTFTCRSRNYTFSAEDPEDGSYWIEWSGSGATSGLADAIADAINDNDGSSLTATAGYDNRDYVSVVANTPGAAGDFSVSFSGTTGIYVLVTSYGSDAYPAYTATSGGPDGNGHYYVDVVAETEGTAGNCGLSTTECDISVESTNGVDEGVVPDSNATVALALATAISGHTPEFIEAAIDPAHTNEVILISLE